MDIKISGTYVYIDTNILLDFYQASTERLQIFQDLVERATSVILTEQTIREFKRNRAARLVDLAKKVGQARFTLHTTAIVQEFPEFAEWVKCRDNADKHVSSMSHKLNEYAIHESKDPVFAEFDKLCRNALILDTRPEAIERAKLRKLLGEPPTTPDKHSIGDELIWETLMEQCQQDLIVVSRDKAFADHAAILTAEFDSSSRRLLFVMSRVGHALAKIGKPSTTISEEESKQLKAKEDQNLAAIESGTCVACNHELEEIGFEGSDGDEYWWMYCPGCSAEYFPRVRNQ